MPSIRITDSVGLNLEIPVESPLRKYLRHDLVNLAALPGLKDELGRTLEATALKPAGAGLKFKDKVELGSGDAELGIQAGVDARFAVLKKGATLFDDLSGDSVTVPEGQVFAAATLTARLLPGITREVGDLTFGFEANSETVLEHFRAFSPGETVQTALEETVGGFSIAGDLEDLAALPPHAICACSGTGGITLTASVEVSTAPNPLAIPGLPAAVPEIALKPGTSLGVSASFQVSGAYELRVRKLPSGIVRLGFYKRDQTELTVGVEARAGIDAGAGASDWIVPLLRAVSKDPQADEEELSRAGLDPQHISDIQEGIKAGVERSVAASLGAQLATLRSQEAAFLYDIDLAALTQEGRRAVNQALDGNLSLIERGGGLSGIALRRSVWKETRERGVTLRLNLLGILNLVSISRLLREGSVVTDPQTGEVTITDKVTAKRLRALMVNAGENRAKIRRLFFEAMVATAVYRASGLVRSVAVTSTHTYFELHEKTGKQAMKDNLDVLEALGLIPASEKQAKLELANRFGRSTFWLETSYGNPECERLFLDEGGRPRAAEHYEGAARLALAGLIQPDDPDAPRRIPAVDDGLWEEMKRLGSPQAVRVLLRDRLGNPPLPLLHAIDGDFAFIAAFWGRTMQETASKLFEVRQFLAANPGIDPDDNRFQSLRKQLARHLANVASDTRERFGDPLGLLALHFAAGRSGKVSTRLECPLFALAPASPVRRFLTA